MQQLDRHWQQHLSLRKGLERLGLEYIPSRSLPMLNAIRVPEDIDEAAVRRGLLDRHGIEIGAGLGPYQGRALRIGLMGHTARESNVVTLLAALELELARQR